MVGMDEIMLSSDLGLYRNFSVSPTGWPQGVINPSSEEFVRVTCEILCRM